jgi:hypothetical protein
MSTVNRLYRRRIGEILVNQGIITAEQLEDALKLQQKSGELLGGILLDMGLVTEADIAKTICIQYQLPFISLANYEQDEKAAALLPKDFLSKHRCLPFDRIGDTLLVMISEVPQDAVITEMLKLSKLKAVAMYVGYTSEIARCISGSVKPGAVRGPVDTVRAKAAPAIDIESATTPTHGDLLADDYETAADAAETETLGTDLLPDTLDIEIPEETEEKEQKPALVFGSNKTLREELDNNWDSIFQPLQGTPEIPPKKPTPKR